MPAGLKEAYRSPFNRSNPASQFYNLSSYTRSSSTDSLRNEAFQSDFNNQYHLGGVSQNNPNRLPSFNPHEKYPPLHPTTDRSLPDYRKSDSDSHSSSLSSLIKDPNQGAGWSYQQTPFYLSTPNTPNTPNTQCSNNKPSVKEQPIPSQTIDDNDDNECNSLIDKVLSNNKCRRLLKKLLNDDDDIMKSLPPYKKTVEGFSQNQPQNETIKTILIYSLGGLLILCILDLFIKLGQILSKK
jgi:hypothetical protein